MANPSIFAAFERMWQHVLAKFDEFGNKTVSVDVPQNFTEEQKEQARANIGINESGHTETDPTVPAWAKTPVKPSYTASEVGADPSGTATTKVNSHNTSNNAHNDIRELISGLTTRLNTLANSDDTTLDQMSEIVAYIKSNKSLIENVTNNKVNVSDIINNLTTNTTNKPLSAAQGVALKALIDAIEVPTKISDLTNDMAVLYTSQSLTESQKAQARANLGITETTGGSSSESINEVYIGTTEPTDENISIWIDPSGESPTETWTFTLSDGTTVTKEVYVK